MQDKQSFAERVAIRPDTPEYREDINFKGKLLFAHSVVTFIGGMLSGAVVLAMINGKSGGRSL